jgi:hypothetical protein
MRFRSLILVALSTASAGAQVPDLQAIMDGLQAKFDAAAQDKWTSTIWPYVMPTPSNSGRWAQQDAVFPGYDHTGDGIKDDDHLAFFQRVLNDDPVAVQTLGRSRVDKIKEVFAANREKVIAREEWYDYEVLDLSRINLKLSVLNISDRPAWLNKKRIRTGQSNSITICVDTGTLFIGTSCFTEDIDLPSIWGEKGMLNNDSPGLGNDIADLLAAYLTIGDQNNVDYLQALLYQLVYHGIFSRDFEPDDAEGENTESGSMEKIIQELAAVPEVDDKSYTVPLLPNIDSDTTFDPPERICLNDACNNYLDIIRIFTRNYGDSIQQGVGRHWLNWYEAGKNGFSTGYEAVFGAEGDFNRDGVSNLSSYKNAGENRELWFINEGFFTDPEGEPVEGEMLEGETMEGEEFLEVPSVIDMMADEAQTLIESAGFRTVIQEECTDVVDEDRVMRQAPDAGQMMPKGSLVGIVVSAGSCDTPCCGGVNLFTPASLLLVALALSAVIFTSQA